MLKYTYSHTYLHTVMNVRRWPDVLILYYTIYLGDLQMRAPNIVQRNVYTAQVDVRWPLKNTGINITVTMASLWRLPESRKISQNGAISYPFNNSGVNRCGRQDSVDGRVRRTFSSSKIYNFIRDPKPLVSWYPIVWIRKRIPKHQALTWLFVFNRSPTRDRLLSWGLHADNMCLLCNHDQEFRDHLFFQCSYSFAIWGPLGSRFGFLSTIRSWTEVMDDLLATTGNIHQKYLSRLAWQATIYELWKERNDRLHRH